MALTRLRLWKPRSGLGAYIYRIEMFLPSVYVPALQSTDLKVPEMSRASRWRPQVSLPVLRDPGMSRRLHRRLSREGLVEELTSQEVRLGTPLEVVKNALWVVSSDGILIRFHSGSVG